MRIYLIDYENVGYAGLSGIKELNADDSVYIFYSDQIKTIPFDVSIELCSTKAKVEFIKTKKSGKNYLDFQLTTFLGYLICKNENCALYIISKDTGFDSAVDFWSERGIKIKRKECIQTKHTVIKAVVTETSAISKKSLSTADFTEEYRKKLRTAVKEENLSSISYSVIYKAIVGSENKTELHNALVKAFNNSKGSSIYKLIKAIYEEFAQNCK